MADYPIPPWLAQPADPASHYQAGLQIGVRIGAEQASQQFAQQQFLYQQQKDAFEEQLKAQKQQLLVDEVVRKHRATAEYRSLIDQGVDPMTALRRVGPDLGVSLTEVERAEALRQHQAAQRTETERWHNLQRDWHQAALKQREEGKDIMPDVVDLGQGIQIIRNKQTGHFQQVNKGIGLPQFINTHLSRYMATQSVDADTAVRDLTRIHSRLPSAPTALPEVETPAPQPQPSAPAEVVRPQAASPGKRRLRFVPGKGLVEAQ